MLARHFSTRGTGRYIALFVAETVVGEDGIDLLISGHHFPRGSRFCAGRADTLDPDRLIEFERPL